MNKANKLYLISGLILLIIIVVFVIINNPRTFSYSNNNVETIVTSDNEIKEKIKKMTIEEKVGQMLLVGTFSNDSNEVIKKLIVEKKIGSVILMNQNIQGKKVLDITRDLQATASSSHLFPLLISVDQEGGTVSRIKDVDSNQTSQPQIKDADQAYSVALERGKELNSKGINVNFSPVLEYITNPSSFLYHRVFRGSKENIISYSENMLRGYKDAGIASTVKHFPGHDNTAADSHKDLPVSMINIESLDEHLRIFKEVIEKENPDMVMTAHVSFPNIDPVYPATLSPFFINILRNEYKYDGIIITDDMNMGAIAKSFGIKDSAIQAIRAGNDILLYVSSVTTIDTAYRSILDAVKNGVITESRIDESVFRVLRLKEKLLL